MTKITLSPENFNLALAKLTPSFVGAYDDTLINMAQTPKSIQRRILFGLIMNAKFIVLKVDKAKANPPLYSISDIYNVESAESLTSLLIYRLAHPIQRAEVKILRMD